MRGLWVLNECFIVLEKGSPEDIGHVRALIGFSHCLFKEITFFLQEYDGTCGTCDVLYREQRERMETLYKDWLIDSAKYKGKPKENSGTDGKSSKKISSAIRSFNALNID